MNIDLRLKDLKKNPIFALRRNKKYYQWMRFVETAWNWTKEDIHTWQWDKVCESVEYAYDHVPYYNKIYKAAGFEPGDLKGWKDFEKLPTISKSDVKENQKDFYSDEINAIPHRQEHTGGSTGQPMYFFVDDEMFYREDAVYRYYWTMAGYPISDSCALLRGHRFMKDDGVFRYKYNPSWRYLLLDSSYIRENTVVNYGNVLRKYNIKNIQAYPSSMTLLAKAYDASGMTPPKLNHIFLGSENVYEHQLEMIQKVFHPKRLINQYGHTERILLALQNLDGEEGLGFVPFYGYAELLDKNGGVSMKSEAGEITGTGFSKCMPFIRYRTNDFAEPLNKSFKRSMVGWKRVKRIEGRLQEYIVTSDKRLVSTCVIAGSHIPELSRIWDMQYVQDRVGELTIKCVDFSGLDKSNEDCKMILKKIEAVLGNKVRCRIAFTDEILRSDRNKKMMLVQNLNVRDYM